MRKPTGPGKVKDDLTLPPFMRQGVSALLYNFDIDDSTVKFEHQLWLDINATRFLKKSRNSRISLKGMASRSGANDYNLALSKRRVDAVKAFLATQGVQPGQFDTTFVGENDAARAGKADGTEDELDRAVALQIKPPARRGLVRFRRLNPFDVLDGFDQDGTPQWLMVPAFGRRTRFLANGEGVRLVSGNPAVIRLIDPESGLGADEIVVSSDWQEIEFEGGMPGEGTIFALDLNGTAVNILQVSVLPKKTVTLAFHQVSDKTHATARPVGDIDTFVAGANRVYNRQANVFFVKKGPKPLTFPTQDLGNPITEATAGSHFSTLTSRGDASARINVFLVWEWNPRPGDTDAEADGIPGANVIFEDNAGTDIEFTFAHECGHCLGLSHTGTTDPSLKPRLMWNFTDERGGLLIPDEARTANAKA